VAAAAAGLAVAVVIASLPGAGHPGSPSAGVTPSSPRVQPIPGITGGAHLTARQVLGNAAAAALAQPDVTPRPDQFVYVKLKVTGGGPTDGISQYWNSVNGERDGMEEVGHLAAAVTYGCVNGRQKAAQPSAKGTPVPQPSPGPQPSGQPSSPAQNPAWLPCTPVRAYLPGMPTTPAALLSYLERTQQTRPGNPNDLGKAVDALLTSDWVTPAQRAALYRLVAKTPGITLVRHVTDVDGRPGAGVAWTYAGNTTVLIFDLRTYAYLGLDFGSVADPQGGDALLAKGIVDRVGQLP
jgi:hypothetical protein